jgi:hypothetical protein
MKLITQFISLTLGSVALTTTPKLLADVKQQPLADVKQLSTTCSPNQPDEWQAGQTYMCSGMSQVATVLSADQTADQDCSQLPGQVTLTVGETTSNIDYIKKGLCCGYEGAPVPTDEKGIPCPPSTSQDNNGPWQL